MIKCPFEKVVFYYYSTDEFNLYRSVVCQVVLGMERMLMSRHFYQKNLYSPTKNWKNINIHRMTQNINIKKM